MHNEIILLGYWPGKRWKQARAVLSGGGLSNTLTAEMGGHGNNFVYVNVLREVVDDEKAIHHVP